MNKALSSQHRHVAVWLVLLAAAGTFALTMGTRQTMGLFLSSLNTSTGLGVGNISLAFAFGQLWWGLTQPFAGAMADKVGAGRVLFVGALLVALGTFITPWMTSTAGLIFAIGVLAAGGAGMAGPAVLMAATTRMIPADKRGLATGIVNAGGSFGQFLMAPIAGALMLAFGWANAMQVLGLLVLLALPAAFLLKGSPAQSAPASHQPVGTLDAVCHALRNPSYLMLAAGFFVCGFHVAFLATHLPGVIAACGLPVQFGAWSLAMLGLTFLSTVPPTAGLVAKFFGTTNMATLFGIVMLTHQLGGFLGAWLGGRVFEATGNYDWVWYIDIVLAVGAAVIHLPILEARVPARVFA